MSAAQRQSDALIGQAVKATRELAGMSQTSLASKMREAGFEWSQPTLTAVEKGARRLTWAEGTFLADLIGFGSVAVEDPTVVEDAVRYRRIVEIIGDLS